MWNPSIFDTSAHTLRPQSAMLGRYVELASAYDNAFANAKYVACAMMGGHGRAPSYQRLTRAKDYAELAAAARNAQADACHFSIGSRSHEKLAS